VKTKKLVRKIRNLLSADSRAQVAKYDSLEKVLRKLDAKHASFREKLKATDNEERRSEIQRKLEVIEAQREKGAELKRELDKLREGD
jgi:hypothetical protein